MKIYKYTLNGNEINSKQTIVLPFTRQFLKAAYHNHEICLWWIVNDDLGAIHERVTFVVKHTGDEVEPPQEQYLASVIDNKHMLVYHIFIKQ